MEKLIKIKDAYDKKIHKATIETYIIVVSRICKLFPLIKKCQPNITGIHTGMGTWSFNGYGIGISTEEECKGEEIKIKDVSIDDIVRSGCPDYYYLPVNKALKDICELLDMLVDTDQLNCSTLQDGFDDSGVLFIHSETSNQNNPFATPNKEYYKTCSHYKELIRAHVNISFVESKTN